MKILVTGASGLIGTELCHELEIRNHEVHKLVRYHAGGFDFWGQSNQHFADLRDTADMQKIVEAIHPEVIINLAAMSAVSYSFQHPEEVNQVNYMGALRLAEIARDTGAWFIQASTSEVYGALAEPPFTEESPVGGTSPYAAAKIATDEYLRIQGNLEQNPLIYTIARPFNTIGRAPRNNRHFVVERAITQALTTNTISLHDHRPQRDFIFRSDHARIYVLMIEKGSVALNGETFVMASGDAWSIEEMAKFVVEIHERESGHAVALSFSETPDRPLDIPILQGDPLKAHRRLDWSTSYTIAGAIEEAYREWHEKLEALGELA